jgi:hypothetical protein
MAREIALDHARQYFELLYLAPEVSLLWWQLTVPPEIQVVIVSGLYLFDVSGTAINNLKQGWYEDWHGETKQSRLCSSYI